MSDQRESDGQRFKRLRRRAGLNQADFGQRMGKSQSWVSRIENDELGLDSIALVNRVARVLNVHPNEVTGRPYRGGTPSEERGHAAIPEIRRVIQRYDLSPDWDAPVRDAAALTAEVAALVTLRRKARYAVLGEQAPSILRELHAAVWDAQGHDAEELYGLLARAYRETDTVAHALGYDDLSTLATERYLWAAHKANDPLLVVIGDYLRVRDLWANDLWADALALMDSALSDLDHDDEPAALSVAGSLYLRAAITAARSCDGPRAWDRLSAAREAIGRLQAPPGFDPYELTFTAPNVAMHGVAVAVELRDGVRAVELGSDVLLPSDMPGSRVGNHYMDMARGQIYFGDHLAALKSIETAERAAPLLVRNHPMAHAAVRALVTYHRSANGGDRLRRLADRMHL
jgi:transcriptional regulator with XRE-family HTH domain